jgi:hypothetical protein
VRVIIVIGITIIIIKLTVGISIICLNLLLLLLSQKSDTIAVVISFVALYYTTARKKDVFIVVLINFTLTYFLVLTLIWLRLILIFAMLNLGLVLLVNHLKTKLLCLKISSWCWPNRNVIDLSNLVRTITWPIVNVAVRLTWVCIVRLRLILVYSFISVGFLFIYGFLFFLCKKLINIENFWERWLIF